MHSAAYQGQTETAFALVKAGANLNIRTNNGETALQLAIDEHGKDSTIAFFLQGAMEKGSSKSRQEAEELLRALE